MTVLLTLRTICVSVISIALLVVAVLFSSGREAGDYPAKPIKLIVPFSAGGGTDTFARMMKKCIEEEKLLPQPLVIMNVKGAGATIGSRRAKVAKADGYTLLLLHDSMMTAKASGAVTYGPEAFTPIAATGELGMVVCVRDDAPYTSLSDLLEAAKQKPDTIRFGVNMGAIVHFAALTLEYESTGSRFRHVQSGSGADRYAHLQGGHTELTAFSVEEFVRFREGGLRALCFFGNERHAAVPNVPTAREQGIDVVFENRFYWWAPIGTPPERLAYIADVLERTMQTKYVRDQLRLSHTAPIFMRDNELATAVQKSDARYGSIEARDTVEPPDLPLILTVGLGILAGVMGIGQLVRAGRSKNSSAKQLSTATIKPLIACVLLTTMYAGSMAWFSIDFRIASTCYIIALAITITNQARDHWDKMLAFAVAASLTIHFILSYQFGVLLP